jgi:hypothetical protein
MSRRMRTLRTVIACLYLGTMAELCEARWRLWDQLRPMRVRGLYRAIERRQQ